jgi:hypothetical protein
MIARKRGAQPKEYSHPHGQTRPFDRHQSAGICADFRVYVDSEASGSTLSFAVTSGVAFNVSLVLSAAWSFQPHRMIVYAVGSGANSSEAQSFTFRVRPPTRLIFRRLCRTATSAWDFIFSTSMPLMSRSPFRHRRKLSSSRMCPTTPSGLECGPTYRRGRALRLAA